MSKKQKSNGIRFSITNILNDLKDNTETESADLDEINNTNTETNSLAKIFKSNLKDQNTTNGKIKIKKFKI